MVSAFYDENFLLQDEWKDLDQADDHLRLLPAGHRVRDGLLHQLHRDLLPRLAGDPLRHDGGRHLHLPVRHPPAHTGGDSPRQEPGGKPGLSVQVLLCRKQD